MDDAADGSRLHCVLVNAEEQYSLWDEGRACPTGWQRVGPVGSRSECLAWIDSVWTDIRPLSARTRADQ